jgi:hypothetical protein
MEHLVNKSSLTEQAQTAKALKGPFQTVLKEIKFFV